jgi:osmoprotectant transport system ATP-binding protein
VCSVCSVVRTHRTTTTTLDCRVHGNDDAYPTSIDSLRPSTYTVHMPDSLAAHDVSHRYGATVALDGVSIDVPPGSALALVGESGSGKTTLLRCFNRMVEPQRGVVRVGETDVRAQPVVALRRRIGYVPQDGGLLPHWRVARNVALVPALSGASDATDRARDALALVGLPADRYGARFPHELSGGQRQRVALARALAARPGVILLDEPFGAVDAITRADLQTAFADVRREIGVTTLLVTHDLAEAARLADRVAVMRAGRVEQCAPFAEIMASPATEYVATLLARASAAALRLA